MPKKPTEAEMCADFLELATASGWTAYPEFAGFDVVIVRDAIQIGIQAKLRFNATVLRQIVPSNWFSEDRGPDFLAVLLPSIDRDTRDVLEFIGIGVLTPEPKRENLHWLQKRAFDREGFWTVGQCNLPQWFAEKLESPEYVPDVRAGASAPLQLTTWKIAALRICAVLEIKGAVTSEDFTRYGIDRRRWIAAGWIVPIPSTPARSKHSRMISRYRSGKQIPFPAHHPTVYPQIVADVRAWFAEVELTPDGPPV